MAASSNFRLESGKDKRYGFNIVAAKIEKSTGFPIFYAQFSRLPNEPVARTFAPPSVETAVVKRDLPKKQVPAVSPSVSFANSFPESDDSMSDYYDSEEL